MSLKSERCGMSVISTNQKNSIFTTFKLKVVLYVWLVVVGRKYAYILIQILGLNAPALLPTNLLLNSSTTGCVASQTRLFSRR